MKITYRLSSDTTVEFEAANTSEIADMVVLLREAQAEPCGSCNKTNTILNYRQNGDDTFYGIHCLDCGSVLSLGVNKEKNKDWLYKKRLVSDKKGKAVKGEDGKSLFLPRRGWQKYNPATNKME